LIMWREFKTFAFKGNVVDLAVGVIIGASFGQIVSALVDHVLMPVIGVLVGGIDLTDRVLRVGEAEVAYGLFLQAVLDFLIVAAVLFVVVRQANRMLREREPEPEAPAEPSQEVRLLTEIRDALRTR